MSLSSLANHPTLLFETLDSTNEEAKRRFHAGDIQNITSILALEQTQGKGTQGRVWVSPPNAGLYLTIIHPKPTDVPFPKTPLFTLAAGVACRNGLNELFDLEIHLKPINDLYAQGKKLGGILTESLIQDGEIQALITGIGINILDIPRPLAPRADQQELIQPTSLQALLPGALWQHQEPRTLCVELAQALVPNLNKWYQRLIDGDQATIQEAWSQYQLPGSVSPF